MEMKKKFKSQKVLFIPNKAMWYRIPLFNELSKKINVEFVFTDEDKVDGLIADYKILKRWGIYPFNVAFGLIPTLLQKKYDAVVFPPLDMPGELIDNILCFIITKLRRKKYIIWSERWNCPEIRKEGYKKIYEWIDNLIFGYISRNSDACVTSGGTKQKEFFLSHGVSSNKIFIVPYLSNIPSKDYDFEDLEKKRLELLNKVGIKNKKIVLCVARLIKRKGIDYLIKAFSKLSNDLDNIVLFIVGGACYYGFDKYYGDKLIELCKTDNIEQNVYFIGELNSTQIPVYYYSCSLLVFPSIAENFADTGCLPVSDAMYFGKPVISTDVVGFAHDLIQNNVNGYLVPQKDVDSLYQAMKTILSSQKLEKKMGNESKKIIAKKFKYKDMVHGFITAIKNALNE